MLRKAGPKHGGDQGAGIPCAGNAHRQTLVLGRIPAACERERHREARAGDAQQEANHVELP